MANRKYDGLLRLFHGELKLPLFWAIYSVHGQAPVENSMVHAFMRDLLRTRGVTTEFGNGALGYVLRNFTKDGFLQLENRRYQLTDVSYAALERDGTSSPETPSVPTVTSAPTLPEPEKVWLARNLFRDEKRRREFAAVFLEESDGAGLMDEPTSFACMRRFAARYMRERRTDVQIRSHFRTLQKHGEIVPVKVDDIPHYATTRVSVELFRKAHSQEGFRPSQPLAPASTAPTNGTPVSIAADKTVSEVPAVPKESGTENPADLLPILQAILTALHDLNDLPERLGRTVRQVNLATSAEKPGQVQATITIPMSALRELARAVPDAQDLRTQ